MTRTCLAIRHLAFEDLGAFAPTLERRGYALRYVEAGVDDLRALDSSRADLVIVLGGPIAVYDDAAYPWLRDEIQWIKARIEADRPTMGICLGAQLIAAAAGARVFPASVKEIGFAPITLSAQGLTSCLAPYADAPNTLHWHGDTFDLPEGANLLASTPSCVNQAFSLGRKIIGFQFHPEAGGPGFERWLIGHALELSHEGIDVAALRRDAKIYAPDIARTAAEALGLWLDQAGL